MSYMRLFHAIGDGGISSVYLQRTLCPQMYLYTQALGPRGSARSPMLV